MEEIIARQNASAHAATGKTFVLGIAQIILELAIAQLIVNFLISASGIGLLNLLFYLYAVVLLVRFMMRTVAGCIYTLKRETLVLQRLMGDSTVLGVEIPLSSIVSIRPIVCAERLHLDYRRVTYVDMACAPDLRMRAAFLLSLIWAGLARVVAGGKAKRPNGYLVVFMDEGKPHACAFRPDAAFVSALEKALAGVFGVDERLARAPREDYAAKSLHRAFGSVYPHVAASITEEELVFEREEFARRREEKIQKAAQRRKIPVERYKAQLAKEEQKKAECCERGKEMLAAAGEKLEFLSPVKEKAAHLAAELAREEAQDEEAESIGQQPARRRRSRQE